MFLYIIGKLTPKEAEETDPGLRDSQNWTIAMWAMFLNRKVEYWMRHRVISMEYV
jgi:hypothetical protein